ncbi:MAG: hypothetical protein M1383_01980 [Patescibacteria group bacterium]|nr:hypothetical protein [Patescibacteria group bacterium]
MSNVNNPDRPVVLFIPEAGIYPYLRGLAVLGDAIQKRGGRVLVTRDSGQMIRTPMAAGLRGPVYPSEGQKTAVARSIDRRLADVRQKYNFSIIELSELVSANLMSEIEKLIQVPDENLEGLVYQGCQVGKIALHDFILETKTFPVVSKLSAAHKELYKAYIKNTALAVSISDEICKIYHPSLFITFNEYSQCQAVRYSAEKNFVLRLGLTYPVHFGTDTSKFCIGKSVLIYPSFSYFQKWEAVKDMPIPPQYVKECWEDVVFRAFTSGSHIFSNKKTGDPVTIFNRLKLNPQKKTIVAYTSSSDERQGMDVVIKIWKDEGRIIDAFSDQIEWLSWLRDQASRRNDIQIVVRVHPREGSRQFGFESQHLKDLKAKFLKNSPNFTMVWPDDPISSYDLMELADVCLISWSTIGQEAARLGMPVLAYAGNMNYPDDDFIQVATSPEEYEKKLNAMLEMDYTWRHLVKAVRFYHWRTFIPSLDLGETVPRGFEDESIWPEAPASKIGIINEILSGKKDIISYNAEQWKASLTEKSAALESEAMRQGTRLFLDKIFYPPVSLEQKFGVFFRLYRKGLKALSLVFGRKFYLKLFRQSWERPFKDYCLEFSPDTANLQVLRDKTRKDKNLRIIAADGPYAILIHKGKLLRRMSPMIVRLARLYVSSLQ